jgi:hypothetical protein
MALPLSRVALCASCAGKHPWSSAQMQARKYADRHESQQLQHGFKCDSQHQSFTVPGCIDAPCAEQHREQRHHQRDREGRIAIPRHMARSRRGQHIDAGGDGFVLQSDVGNGGG